MKFEVIPAQSARESLTEAIAICGKSQRALARLAGLRPNVLSMMCTGAMAIPAGRACALAMLVGLDSATFALQALRDTNASWYRELDPILVRDRYEAAILEVSRIRRRRAGLPGVPELPSTSAMAALSAALDRVAKTRIAVATAAGVAPNVVSLMKSGEMAIPPERIRSLARAVELDGVVLLHLVLRDANASLHGILAPRIAADQYEEALLRVARIQARAATPA